MANIEVKDDGSSIDINVNDQALLRRYEKRCGLDAKKVLKLMDAFLSHNR